MVTAHTTGYAHSGGAQIYYKCYGAGEPALVLLHGNGEDRHCFDKQIYDFSHRHLTITVDSRGHGKSTFGTEPLSIEQMAKDTFAVLDDMGLEKAVIIGFSDGGNVAIEMARQNQSRIHKLIVAGPNLNPQGVKWVIQLPIVLGYMACRFIGLFDERARRKAQILNLMVSYPKLRTRDISGIQLPSLIIGGQHDMIKYNHLCQIADAIDGAQLLIIEGADHFVFDKASNIINKDILDYIVT